MKIIIIGAGEVGFQIAQKLSDENQEVFLIDKDPEKIRSITEKLDVQAILGSGTSPKILKTAGIKGADMLVAATDSDEVNLIACLLARHLTNYIVKVARIRDPEYLEEMDLFSSNLLAVDEIINPASVMVETIKNLISVPGATDVIDFAGGRVKLIGITVKPGSPAAGRQLLSFKDMEGTLLVGAIVRGEQVFIPHGQDTIMADDLVYLVARTGEIPLGRDFFGFREKEVRRVMIVGGGMSGAALAGALDDTKLHVKIIEKDPRRCTALADTLKRVVVINGDGTDRNLLQEENIADTDFMISVTGDEESNVIISLLGKRLGVRKCITRINKLSYIPLVSAIGIDTVVSSRLSAIRAILQYIRKGKVISVAPLKGEHAEAIEAEAMETSDVVNVPLAKVKFPKGAIVGAVVRGEEIIIPRGDTIIQPGDHLVIFALHKVLPRLEKLLTVKLEFF